MNSHRDPIPKYAGINIPDKDIPDWCRWQGKGEKPKCWWATDPKSGTRIQVFRSYEDYCAS